MSNPRKLEATEPVPIGMIFHTTIFVFIAPLGKVKNIFDPEISLRLVFNMDQTLERQTRSDKPGSVKLV